MIREEVRIVYDIVAYVHLHEFPTETYNLQIKFSQIDNVYNRIGPHIGLVESIYGNLVKRKEYYSSLYEKRDSIMELIKKNADDSKIKHIVELIR